MNRARGEFSRSTIRRLNPLSAPLREDIVEMEESANPEEMLPW